MIEARENNQVGAGKTNGILTVNDVSKRFGANIVLDNVSLTIEEGKTTVVIGPSGCGKTVLIKHLIVLLRPNLGEVYFRKQRIDNLGENDLNEVRTHFGFLFQGGALFDSLSVFENIIFPLRQHHKITNWRKVEELVKAKLAVVGLDGYQDYYPANLSGGQRKRVALARAIALSPEVILYTLGILANRLDSLFEKSNNDNRRLLCETVFRQVRVREGKIVDMEMNSPFTIIFSQAKGSESLLSGQPDLSSGAFV